MVVFIAGLLLVLIALIIYLYFQLQTAREDLARERTRIGELGERIAQAESKAMLHASEYLKKEEAHMRADAVARSTRVVKGKVAEQLVPFGPEFGYNPRDCRFVGSPFDFLVMDGLTEGALDKIVFVEVKTGLSRLSKRERQVRDIIDTGEVFYEEVRL